MTRRKAKSDSKVKTKQGGAICQSRSTPISTGKMMHSSTTCSTSPTTESQVCLQVQPNYQMQKQDVAVKEMSLPMSIKTMSSMSECTTPLECKQKSKQSPKELKCLKSQQNSEVADKSAQKSSHSLTEPSEEEEPNQISETVSNYLMSANLTVIKYIISSSTCSVYLVQNGACQDLAAKVIDHSKLDESIVKNCLPNELAIVRSVKHDNIVSTYAVLTDLANYSIIISEYAAEGDLITHTNRNRNTPPTIAQTKKWFLEITNALTYLHQKFIAHGDVKPDNVLICEGLSAKLTDFGFATYCRNEKGEPILCESGGGTLSYNAPEATQSESYDAMIADSFSLGVLLYVMLTLKYPFLHGKVLRTEEGLAMHQQRIRAKQWPKIGPIEHDQSLQSLLSQLLNPDVHERILVAQVPTHRWMEPSM